MTKFRVLEPEDWGMVWLRPPVKERLLDPEMFAHHRAGNPRHTADAEIVFREMQAGDVSRGYSTVGYDILVHENTVHDLVTIGIARGAWMSAATADRNEQGEAVCAIGDFHYPSTQFSATPSPAMLEGMARAFALSIERGWSARGAILLPHSGNPAHPNGTACPGNRFVPYLPWLRNRINQLIAPPPVYVPPHTPTVFNPAFLKPKDTTPMFTWNPRGYADAFLIGAGDIVHLSPAAFNLLSSKIPHIHQDDHDGMLNSVLYQVGRNRSDLTPL